MAIIFENKWPGLNGDASEHLGANYHYHKRLKALVVEPGEVVTIYRDATRNERSAWPFHEGRYEDVGFYGVPEIPGCIHIEKTDVADDQLVTIGWWADWEGRPPGHNKLRMTLRLPVGEFTALHNADFPNDTITFCLVPFGYQVELFPGFDANGKGTGGSLIFQGDHAETRTDEEGNEVVVKYLEKHVEFARDFGWTNVLSAITVTSEDWVFAGVSIKDSTISVDKENSFAGTARLADNLKRPIDPETGERISVINTVEQVVSASATDTMSENWNSEVGGGASLGFTVDVSNATEAGGGVPGVGEVKNTTTVSAGVHGDVSINFSDARGGENSHSQTKDLSAKVSIQSEQEGVYDVSLFVEYGIISGTAVKKWRNKRTGITVEKQCTFVNKHGFQVNATFDGEPIAVTQVDPDHVQAGSTT